MNHFVLTRSGYPATYPLDANRRRLDLLRAVTVPAMKAQTSRSWTWLALIDPDDPLLRERIEAFESSGVPVRPVTSWSPAMPRTDTVLMTRIDDDDAFFPHALQRIRDAAEQWTAGRVAWVFPWGWRVYRGQAERMHHPANMFVTLQTPPGDDMVVMDVNHLHISDVVPVRLLEALGQQ